MWVIDVSEMRPNRLRKEIEVLEATRFPGMFGCPPLFSRSKAAGVLGRRAWKVPIHARSLDVPGGPILNSRGAKHHRETRVHDTDEEPSKQLELQ